VSKGGSVFVEPLQVAADQVVWMGVLDEHGRARAEGYEAHTFDGGPAIGSPEKFWCRTWSPSLMPATREPA
jgi:hypothetical protein